jgi:hypothetical protein
MRGLNKTRKQYQQDTGINITRRLEPHTLYWQEDGEDREL